MSTREINENGEVGVGCTVSSIPVAELNSLGDDTSSFSIEQDADGTRFNAVLEGVDELAGDPAETDAMVDLLGLDLDDLFTIRFVVSAPGSLGSNNASSTSGSTATWDVKADADFVTDGDATMTAEWTPGGGGGSSSTLLIVLIIAALAAIAAIAVVLFKRSKATPRPSPDGAGRSDLGHGPACDDARRHLRRRHRRVIATAATTTGRRPSAVSSAVEYTAATTTAVLSARPTLGDDQ